MFRTTLNRYAHFLFLMIVCIWATLLDRNKKKKTSIEDDDTSTDYKTPAEFKSEAWRSKMKTASLFFVT